MKFKFNYLENKLSQITTPQLIKELIHRKLIKISPNGTINLTEELITELEKIKTQAKDMKSPKCLTCRNRTELVICYCQEPQKVHFCWICRQHYPLRS